MTHFPPDPLSDPDLSSIWSSLRAPAQDEELADEQRLVALITAHASTATLPDASRSRMSTMFRVKLATAGLAAALFASSGLAYAGVLPGAARSTASDMLAKVGITVPGPNSHAGTHPNSRGQSTADANSADQPTVDTGDQPTTGSHGQTVSQLARTTTETGRAKGTTIAAAASNGRSTNGQNPAARASSGHSTSGQDTAASAGNGHSTSGRDTAATASKGHSTTGQSHASAGSGNAPAHHP